MKELNKVMPYLLLAPSVVFLVFFFFSPFVETFFIAFKNAEGGYGLHSFRKMYDDLNFFVALKNTIFLLFAVVPLQLVLAVWMSLTLRKIKKFRGAILYIWTIPLGISDLAAGIIWLSILTERGYLNTIFLNLGFIEKPELWLSYEHPLLLFAAVAIAEIWRSLALVLLIIIAGLQLIPKEYDEAADVFGAGAFRKLFRVTLPLLKPSIQSALILRSILALEVFAVAVAIGGTNLPVLASEAYNWMANYLDYGVASAYALVLLALSIISTLGYLFFLRTPADAA